jgi:hypothetical protein
VWRELRDEYHDSGFEVVSVAIDSGSAAKVREYIQAAKPTHPSLLDAEHVTTQLYGFVNAPSSVWIDERGMLVRPPETVYALRGPEPVMPADATPDVVARVTFQRTLRDESRRYTAALRDWIEKGAASRYALPADEVIRRSQPRPPESSRAAAEFALGRDLHGRGDLERAARHFNEARRLDPANWTYARQAFSLAGDERERLYATDLQRERNKPGAPPLYQALDKTL